MLLGNSSSTKILKNRSKASLETRSKYKGIVSISSNTGRESLVDRERVEITENLLKKFEELEKSK